MEQNLFLLDKFPLLPLGDTSGTPQRHPQKEGGEKMKGSKEHPHLGSLSPLVHLFNLSSGFLYNKNAYITPIALPLPERPVAAGLFYLTTVTVSPRSIFPSMAS